MPKTLTADDIKAIKQTLRRSQQLMQSTCDFKRGQLVRWKDGLQNRTRPAYGEPAIVWEVLPEPLYAQTDESGSAYYREPLDIILGVVGPDDEFIQFHFDKRRFEPFPE